MSGDSLVEGVQNFLLAGTWEASRAVVRAQPVLLGEDAQALLGEMAARAERSGDSATAEILELHRELLARSSSEGIDEAFSDVLGDAEDGLDDIDQIIGELAHAPLTAAEIPRRVELCLRGLEQVAREEDPELWALLQAALGTALLMSVTGDRAADIERAIAALEDAAGEFGELRMQAEHARARNNLGLALEARVQGAPDENLEAAIAAYKQALEQLGGPAAALERAETLNNLANAYNRRQRGLRDDNRERAIAYYTEAVELLGDDDSVAWVKTRLNLGVALTDRLRGDRAGNLTRAIAAFAEALRRVDPLSDATLWADLHANLGNAHVRRAAATGDDEDVERAIVSYEAALEAYGEAGASLNRALTLSNLANALLARRAPTAEATEHAISCYREALRILDPMANPLDWAQAKNNLGRVYREREAGDRSENLELAIEAFEDAARILDAREAPVQYAQVVKNLGTAYRERIAGDRSENLAKAMRAYENALELRTQIYGPHHPRVASVLYSIAKVQRASGDERAAQASLERALEIDERSGEPLDHLAAGYRNLATIAGGLDDLEAAEHAIERALEIDEELQGPDHPDVFADLHELAKIRERLGRPVGAIDALERAVTIEDLGAAGAQSGVHEALSDLSDMLRKAGDLAAAEQTMERAVALEEALFGPAHPRVADSLVKLAELLTEAHDVARAKETLERAAGIERAAGGRLRPRSAAALATLSRTLDGSPAPPAPVVEVVGSPPAPLPPAREPVRLRYPEVLRGHVAFGVEDPQEARKQGRRDGMWLAMSLQVQIDDAERFLSDPDAAGHVRGTVTCPGLGGERPIRRGTFRMRRDGDGRRRRTIAYELDVDGGEAGDHRLRGRRLIDDDDPQAVLREASALAVEIRAADGRTATGVLTVRHLDFLEQLGGISVDAPTPARRLATLDRFGRACFGPLWEFRERQAAELTSRPPQPGA